MTANEIKLGTLVKSVKGRDEGRIYLVRQVLGENMVLLVDGNFKKVNSPKPKKLKHLTVLDLVAVSIGEKFEEGKQVYDSEIFSAIKKLTSNAEDIENKQI